MLGVPARIFRTVDGKNAPPSQAVVSKVDLSALQNQTKAPESARRNRILYCTVTVKVAPAGTPFTVALIATIPELLGVV